MAVSSTLKLFSHHKFGSFASEKLDNIFFFWSTSDGMIKEKLAQIDPYNMISLYSK